VEVFNRKLGKQMKIVENVTPLKVDSDRNLFTKHGLHMNKKGKEQAAKKIVSTINYILGRRERERKEEEGRSNQYDMEGRKT
jgi:hypothetical protein